MSPRRSAADDLVRAREALARARERGADPWRLVELQTKYDALLERALEEDAATPRPELVRRGPPEPRRRAEPFPMAWVDESGRSRRGDGGGEPS